MLARYPEIQIYLSQADHLDVKSIETRTRLRPFIAGMLAYHPWWIRALYRFREVLVYMLGLEKHEMPDRRSSLAPQSLPFTPGGTALFFTVKCAREEHYWVAQTPPDKHLTAFLGVTAEPLASGAVRFNVFTAVRYLHWTGPVYFNLIRPFHHLVVWRMMKAGSKAI
jgi:hypothetical protein